MAEVGLCGRGSGLWHGQEHVAGGHVAGCGGMWQVLVAGCGGMWLGGEGMW